MGDRLVPDLASTETSESTEITNGSDIKESTSASEVSSSQAQQSTSLKETESHDPAKSNGVKEGSPLEVGSPAQDAQLTEKDVDEESERATDERERNDSDLHDGDLHDGLLERGRKQAPIRIQQFSQYFRIMEARVAVLEKMIKEKRLGDGTEEETDEAKAEPSATQDQQADDAASDSPKTDEPESAVEKDCTIAGIRRCDGNAFLDLIDDKHYAEHEPNEKHEKGGKREVVQANDGENEVNATSNLNDGDKKDNKQEKKVVHGAHSCRHVVELLVSETILATRKSSGQDASKDELLTSNQNQLSKPNPALSAKLPQRIRVRGEELLNVLNEAAEPEEAPFEINKRYTKVWTYPFAFFRRHEHKIRRKYSDLKEEVDSLARSKELEEHPKLESTNNDQNEYSAPSGEDPAQSTTSPEEPHKAKTLETKRRLLEQLGVVITLFETDLKPLFSLQRQLEEVKVRTVAFKDLWLLFKHGEEVRSGGSESQIYRVRDYTGGRELITEKVSDNFVVPEFSKMMQEKMPGAFHIECLSYSFDGSVYAPNFQTFSIRKYDGDREVTELPIYPLRFEKDLDKLRPNLIKRGQRFVELAHRNQTAHKNYSGLSLGDHPEEVDSEIIIDMRFALMYNKYWIQEPQPAQLAHDPRESLGLSTCSLDSEDCCSGENYFKDFVGQRELAKNVQKERPLIKPTDSANEFGPEELILLPTQVYGFVLRSRKWAKFNIDLVEDVTYSNAFDDLVLREGHKEKVLALVKNHLDGSKARGDQRGQVRVMDIVPGKGKGLIILLHGEPGVGKTSTAECVAGYTKRPLFPITCGDLGETAAHVEDNLEKNFQLAHRWGCVLLLDEADVFLAERTRVELQRNAIVSVFLRTLEYYSGILFLTTNRVGAFDPAFKSRIHLSLYYPRLDKQATSQIWRMHIKRIKKLYKEHGKTLKVEKDDIVDFAREHYDDLIENKLSGWNGRQIRNAFQTAVALAEYKAQNSNETPKLTSEQFRDVAHASREFDNIMRKTMGGASEQDMARLNRNRYDEDYDNKERSKREVTSNKTRSKVTAATGSSRKSKAKKVKSDVDSEEDTDTEDEKPTKNPKGNTAPNQKDSGEREEVGGTETDSSDSGGSDSAAKPKDK